MPKAFTLQQAQTGFWEIHGPIPIAYVWAPNESGNAERACNVANEVWEWSPNRPSRNQPGLEPLELVQATPPKLCIKIEISQEPSRA